MRSEQSDAGTGDVLESHLQAWRAHLRRSSAVTDADVEELEDHLREQIGALAGQGLSTDEALLVAVKRLGAVDALTREFAQEHSDRLWKQLVLADRPGAGGAAGDGAWGTGAMWVALALALAAAAAMKLPALFGIPFDPDRSFFYPLNIAFLTLPFIAAYFAWERPVARWARMGLAAGFALAAAAVNAFPFPAMTAAGDVADTEALTALHLPIALWLAVGVAYVGGRWRGNERRMDFLRFTGEAFIYYVLIALGGGVLIALTFALFGAIAIDVEPFVTGWLLPAGVAGATV
ncbi:MAG: permease prefix domain 1-containing protein, partial [Longimicrobiales bacterium]|nr:permease prefix domain 1-containing protein [Longimicrobiales bacterium]